VLIRFGTSPTRTTAFTFIDGTSIAVTERMPALETYIVFESGVTVTQFATEEIAS